MNQTELHTLGIDIGSTTVKIAVLDRHASGDTDSGYGKSFQPLHQRHDQKA